MNEVVLVYQPLPEDDAALLASYTDGVVFWTPKLSLAKKFASHADAETYWDKVTRGKRSGVFSAEADGLVTS